MFGWFKSEKRERRRKVKLDRKHLEARSRRFLKSYLNADETRKPQFYRAVEEASKQCHPVKSGLPPPELEDAQFAEAPSGGAPRMPSAPGATCSPSSRQQLVEQKKPGLEPGFSFIGACPDRGLRHRPVRRHRAV